jgi:hypothetical protein
VNLSNIQAREDGRRISGGSADHQNYWRPKRLAGFRRAMSRTFENERRFSADFEDM